MQELNEKAEATRKIYQLTAQAAFVALLREIAAEIKQTGLSPILSEIDSSSTDEIIRLMKFIEEEGGFDKDNIAITTAGFRVRYHYSKFTKPNNGELIHKVDVWNYIKVASAGGQETLLHAKYSSGPNSNRLALDELNTHPILALLATIKFRFLAVDARELLKKITPICPALDTPGKLMRLWDELNSEWPIIDQLLDLPSFGFGAYFHSKKRDVWWPVGPWPTIKSNKVDGKTNRPYKGATQGGSNDH